MIDSRRIVLGIIISTAIGAFAYYRGSLSGSGWLGAIITGTLTFGFGGLAHGASLVFFFVSSTMWSRLRKHQKSDLDRTMFEKGSRRDIWQALANGGIAAVACLCGSLWPEYLLQWNACFVGALATVAADTWATELGVLAKRPPRLITTFKSVPRGTSGAISSFGTLATALGAMAVGIIYSGSTAIFTTTPVIVAFIGVATVAGVIGSLSDSLMGATVQRRFAGRSGLTEQSFASDGTWLPLVFGWRWMNNDAVNFISSLIGALVAVGLMCVIN
ncbi:MAG: DUF92 domain-containing protein [Chloroflexales bacterium]|nr:DUF92 domain-containing protein [Chloroflexales bacterium]